MASSKKPKWNSTMAYNREEEKNSFWFLLTFKFVKYSQNYHITIKNDLVNTFRQQFQLQEKYSFTIETKTSAILERDEVQPNKSLVCNLGSVLTTKNGNEAQCNSISL